MVRSACACHERQTGHRLHRFIHELYMKHLTHDALARIPPRNDLSGLSLSAAKEEAQNIMGRHRMLLAEPSPTVWSRPRPYTLSEGVYITRPRSDPLAREDDDVYRYRTMLARETKARKGDGG